MLLLHTRLWSGMRATTFSRTSLRAGDCFMPAEPFRFLA